VWLGVFAFIATTLWWLTQDDRVPDYDSGVHMIYALVAHNEIATGHLTAPFTDFNTYPPLVHLVGALAISLFGMHPMALILSSNVVFVPLLALGCYGVGKHVGGPRAGLLAALFALATPMFTSMMHEYDLDPPQAAMVAVGAWALLASRRFERAGIALLAGLLTGLALLTKETSVVFLAGLVAAIVVRGGWRYPFGLFAFVIGAVAVAGWWYAYHWSEITSTLDSIGGLAATPLQAPPRWSVRNFGWYFWNLSNVQICGPFLAALVVGSALAVRESARRLRDPDTVLPELLAGGLFSYLGMTWLVHKDPRYTLPALVYVAVLATWWIPRVARPRLRSALTATLLAVALLNFAGMSTGLDGTVAVRLPGAQDTIIRQHEFVLYQSDGWVRGGPVHDGAPLSLMRGLHRLGIRDIEFDGSDSPLDFNTQGLTALAASAGMVTPPALRDPPHNAYVLLRAVRPGDPAPCQRLNDGSGVYVVGGDPGGIDVQTLTNPGNPAQQYTLICPGRQPLRFPTAAGRAKTA
jgi:4-amino-4-deoxy-L-arabinose transferase-like glycosyltransferase